MYKAFGYISEFLIGIGYCLVACSFIYYGYKKSEIIKEQRKNNTEKDRIAHEELSFKVKIVFKRLLLDLAYFSNNRRVIHNKKFMWAAYCFRSIWRLIPNFIWTEFVGFFSNFKFINNKLRCS